MVGRQGRRWAVIESGLISRHFRVALAAALGQRPVERASSLEQAFDFGSYVVFVAGDGVDPVAPIHRLAPERRSHVLVTCERADGCEVARWARAGITNCFVGEESLGELRAFVQSRALVDTRGVRLDASDLAVEIAGMRTRLTRTQFRLLQHLNATSGRWVTAAELVKEALGTHHQDASALVRVHVHAIRRALGPVGSLIETDPGRSRGYRFRSDLAQSACAAPATTVLERSRM